MVQQEYGRQKMVLPWLLWLATQYGLFKFKSLWWYYADISYIVVSHLVSLSCRMNRLNYVHFLRTGPNLFCLPLLRKVIIGLMFEVWTIFLLLFSNLERLLIKWTGDKFLAAVWDISTWKRIGYKKLLKKPASVMSTSLDGKYLAM